MLTEILLLNPVYVTIFWFFALIANNAKTHKPKVFLAWFMATASVLYLSHFVYFTQNYSVYVYLDSIYTLAYLLVYPMYHVYVRLLTVDSSFLVKSHGRYFIAPLLIFVAVLLGYLIMGYEESLAFIVNILVNGDKAKGIHLYMKILFVTGRVVFILQTVLYLYLSYKLIKENNLRLQDYYSNMEERRLNWVQFFNICLAFTSVSSGVLASLGRNFFLQNPWLLIFPSAVFTTMLFIIGLLGNKQKAIFTEVASVTEVTEEGKPPLRLKKRLEELFEKEMIYKNTDLKIWDLTSMLGTNRTYVSKLINTEYGRNFCAHVNHYRIEHAKQLIEKNKNLSNEQIAELSGFGSLNSFYRSFQSVEGISVGAYRKQ